jgi:hypothetical protein
MYGQIDLAGYPSACRLMRNFVCRVHGGAQKRPGTIFITEIKDSTQEARLIAFQYSTEQAYCLEVGDAYMRFLKDRGQILNGDDDPYEIGTCFVQANIAKLRTAQDKDLMYFFNRNYPPQKLIRNADDAWEIENVTFINGPYLPERDSEEQGTNLITNGDMEDDSNWTTAGTPIFQVRSDEKIYEGTYARRILAHTADHGIDSDPYTTETGVMYRLRFRVLTFAGTFKIKIHDGSDSGTWLLEETITEVPVNTWTEYERAVMETTGGTAAYVEFLTALTANVTGYVSAYPYDYVVAYVKATSYDGMHYLPPMGANPNLSLTGITSDRCWRTTTTTNQRFHIDLSEEKVITRVYYENYHNEGGFTTIGVQNFTLWGSNSPTAFAELTYGTDTGWTQITTTTSAFDKHASVNTADPKYIAITATKPYRYYAFKFADNYGSGEYLGVRRIELQEAEYEADANIYIDKVETFVISGITMAPSATTGTAITLTASKAFFVAGHIGAFISITHTVGEDTTTGYARITGITSDTVAVAEVIIDFSATTAVTTWKEGAWSEKNGYPSCGTFYEQRLMCAGSDNDPDCVWGSKSTEYENFTPGTADADPVTYKLQSDIIRWLSAMGQLVIGTVNAEFRLGAQSNNEPLSPTNVKMTQQSRKGSAETEPVNCGNTILFVQRRGNSSNYGKKLRELSYNYVNDSYDGIDLTLFAEHITSTGLKRIVFMSSPFPILWACTNDGRLIGMTYEREQKVIGWHYHPMDGLVEDLCVIPGDNQDDLYMIVNRTIDGETKRYIEVMSDFDWGADQEDCFFVDCGLSYDGTPVSSVSGLDHLEGKTVAVLADGIVQDQKVVTAGAITLDDPASVIHVGLPYTSELEPLDLQGGSMEGTSQGKVKRIHGVALSLYQSSGGEIGQDSSHTERIFFKEETAAAGAEVSLYTGIKENFNFSGDWEIEGRVYIKHDDPLPLTVLSILPRFRVEDK